MPRVPIKLPSGEVVEIEITDRQAADLGIQAVPTRQPPTVQSGARDLGTGFVSGLRSLGISGAELANRMLAGEPMRPAGSTAQGPVAYDPALYEAARAENEAPDSPMGQVGRMAGEIAPTLPVMGMGGGPGAGRALARMAVESLQGAIVGGTEGPEGALPGAMAGVAGSVIGGATSPKTKFGSNRLASMEFKRQQGLTRILAPTGTPEVVAEAEAAVPYLTREFPVGGKPLRVVARNPFANTTRRMMERQEMIMGSGKAGARRGLAGALEDVSDLAEQQGVRISEKPSRAALATAREELQLPGTQVPKGGQLTLTWDNLLLPNGKVDMELVRTLREYGLTSGMVRDLRKGVTPAVNLSVEGGVVPSGTAAFDTAYQAESKRMGRDVTKARIHEAARTGEELSDLAPGIPYKGARKLRQSLDVGRFGAILPGTRGAALESSAGASAEKLAADTLRGEVNKATVVVPGGARVAVGSVNEPFHRLEQIGQFLERRSALEKHGVPYEKVVQIRALANLARGSLKGGMTPMLAYETLASPVFASMSASLRGIIGRQLAAGHADVAIRLMTRYAESSLADSVRTEQKNRQEVEP